MSFEVIIQPSAERDIDEICAYYEKHFLSPGAARNFVHNVQETFKKLQRYPEIGIDVTHRLARPFYRNYKLYMIIIGNYFAFYFIHKKQVQVLRVLYQGRNWIDLFSK
ncbi:MAG: type II toxin-antitoxin system RelE/ParE family toxin [Streptococcaceae bacterium]|jgi:plasmid stabilization system protein ParE|nr:type II toxin-antitoxin system RelE/ParE family toxin [Streptococcaceae bacterium]